MADRVAKARRIRVTDHALIRWIERAGLIDVDALRAAIEDSLDRAFAAGDGIGACNFLIVAGGMVYVVRDGSVTTVINDNGRYACLLDFDPASGDRG